MKYVYMIRENQVQSFDTACLLMVRGGRSVLCRTAAKTMVPTLNRFGYPLSSPATVSSPASRLSVVSTSTRWPRSQRANWWTINPTAMLAA